MRRKNGIALKRTPNSLIYGWSGRRLAVFSNVQHAENYEKNGGKRHHQNEECKFGLSDRSGQSDRRSSRSKVSGTMKPVRCKLASHEVKTNESQQNKRRSGHNVFDAESDNTGKNGEYESTGLKVQKHDEGEKTCSRKTESSKELHFDQAVVRAARQSVREKSTTHINSWKPKPSHGENLKIPLTSSTTANAMGPCLIS